MMMTGELDALHGAEGPVRYQDRPMVIERTWIDEDDIAYARDEAGNPYELSTQGWDRIYISHVWTAHGHQFLNNDDNYVSCMRCGAMYQEIQPDDADPKFGKYVTADGKDAAECTGNTSMDHGYEVKSDNCILCDS